MPTPLTNQVYEAFISYRHVALDAAVARRIHTMIENFKIPRAIKKLTGREKMGKVFRDLEELPFTPDLGDNIKAALSASGFLIVVCSPDLLVSRWCLKEISDFIALRGREKILPVMIAGDEETSIPPELRGIAPAADLRNGINKKVMNRELAKLMARILFVGESISARRALHRYRTRLLAPILNIDEKELVRRLRESGLIRRGAAILVLALITGLFGTYGVITGNRIAANNALIIEATEKAEQAKDQAEAQNQAALIGQSEYLAELSARALDGGDVKEALKLAIDALPDDLSAPSFPISKAAEGALRSAEMSDTLSSGYYEMTQHIDFGVKLEAASTALKDSIFIFSKELDNCFGYWDIHTGERSISSNPLRLKGIPQSVQLSQEKISINSIYSGITASYPDRLESYSSSRGITILAKEETKGAGTYTKVCHLTSHNQYVLFGAENLPLALKGPRLTAKISGEAFSADEVVEIGSYVFAWQDHGRNGKPPRAGLWFHNSEEPEFVMDIPEGIVSVSTPSKNGSLLTVDRVGIIRVFAVPTGKLISQLTCHDGYSFAFFPVMNEKIVAITNKGEALLLHTIDGSILTSYPSEGAIRTARLARETDAYYLLCSCADNQARVYNLELGTLLYTLSAKGPLQDACFMGYSEALYSHDAKNIALIEEKGASIYMLRDEVRTADDDKRFTLLSGGTSTNYVESARFSPGGEILAVSAALGNISVYNSKTGALLWFHSLPTDVASFINYDAPAFNGDGSAIWFPMARESGKTWLMVDSVTGKELMRVKLSDDKQDKVLGTPQYLMDEKLIFFRTMSWLDDEAVCMIDAISGEHLWEAFFYNEDGNEKHFNLSDIAVHEAGTELLISFQAADRDTGKKIWKIERHDVFTGAVTGTFEYILPGQTKVNAFSPDGEFWMVCSRDVNVNKVRVYNMISGEMVDARSLLENEGIPRWDRTGSSLLIERFVPGSEFSDARILWTPGADERVFAAGSAQWRESGAEFIGSIGEHDRVTVESQRYLIDIDSGDTLLDAGQGFRLLISPEGRSVFRYSLSALPRIIFWRPLSEVMESAKHIVAAMD